MAVFQSELFGCKVADGLAVHGEVHGAGGGSHLDALLLEVVEAFGADGLYFGHDDVRTVFLYDVVQRFAVKHGENFAFVGHLHGRGSGVGVTSNNVLAQSLGSDNELFSEFARTKKQYLFHRNDICKGKETKSGSRVL